MASSRPNINSVLARFEQTIEENNAAGANSGMYLTNMLVKDKKATRRPSRRPNLSNKKATSNRRLNLQLPDARKEKTTADSTVSTATMTHDEWDPFTSRAPPPSSSNHSDFTNNNMSQGSFSSFGSVGSFGFEEADFGGDNIDFGATFENVEDEKKERKTRKEKKKSRSRLGSRKTKAQLELDRKRKPKGGKGDVKEDDTSQHGDEEDDGFAVTYIARKDQDDDDSDDEVEEKHKKQESVSMAPSRSLTSISSRRLRSGEGGDDNAGLRHRSSRRSSHSEVNSSRRFVRTANGAFRKASSSALQPAQPQENDSTEKSRMSSSKSKSSSSSRGDGGDGDAPPVKPRRKSRSIRKQQ